MRAWSRGEKEPRWPAPWTVLRIFTPLGGATRGTVAEGIFSEVLLSLV